VNGNATRLYVVADIADGIKTNGRPSLRYITLLRDGARTHGLPDHWLRHLDGVRPAHKNRGRLILDSV
jgi:hypothetical protein